MKFTFAPDGIWELLQMTFFVSFSSRVCLFSALPWKLAANVIFHAACNNWGMARFCHVTKKESDTTKNVVAEHSVV